MKQEIPHQMTSYDEFVESFRIEVPEYYNFGFDVIDKWAETDRNKLAMIWVSQDGREKKYTFRDLRNLSVEAANILIKYGVKKRRPGDAHASPCSGMVGFCNCPY